MRIHKCKGNFQGLATTYVTMCVYVLNHLGHSQISPVVTCPARIDMNSPVNTITEPQGGESDGPYSNCLQKSHHNQQASTSTRSVAVSLSFVIL